MDKYLCLQDFIFESFRAYGLKECFYLLVKVLIRYIPAERILCSMIDRATGKRTVLGDYNASGSHSETMYVDTMQYMIPYSKLKELMKGQEGSTAIVKDNYQDAELREHMRRSLHESYRSALILSLHLPKKEELILQVSMFCSGPDMFSEEHREILALFRDPLERFFTENLLLDGDTVYFSADDFSVKSSVEMLRRCPGLGTVLAQIKAVAGLNTTVLITGESGVGKELAADAIHTLSQRRNGPFVKVNCGAVPEGLADSAFFGHEKGAFTGANASHKGYFEQAQGGTAFLDEIGELSLQLQTRLLRVLESHEIYRIGASRPTRLNVRIIAATNKNLDEMARQGKFREDLLYRLKIFPLLVPPLRERMEDLPVLAELFYDFFAKETGLAHPPSLTRDYLIALAARPWPGNVRQLKAVVERSVILAAASGRRKLLLPDELSYGEAPASKGGRPANEALSEEAVRKALRSSHGRIAGENGAARLLGCSPATVRARMKIYGIDRRKA
ncbi:MAG: sigma-54-dependent Fis family transcriptional regulator [Mailhella sp.]|nr:sigma-54-dependent Fis family transcriptional regulator [Mailhella sp.]